MKRQRIDIKKAIKKRMEHRHQSHVFIEKKTLNMNSRDVRRTQPVANPINVELLSRDERRTKNIVPFKENKKINVVISAYDCAEFIEECLDSVAKQSYQPEKILLGIDGCEKTLEKVKEIRHKYQNIQIYYAETNKGPYQMFNALIQLVPDDEYIQIFGADDVMNSDMLERMAKYDTPAISRNHGVLFVQKEIIKRVGGFRGWRCAADTDMIFRLEKVTGSKIRPMPQYFFRREHEKQLTKQKATNHNSKLRKKYIKIYEKNKASQNPEIYITPICNHINII